MRCSYGVEDDPVRCRTAVVSSYGRFSGTFQGLRDGFSSHVGGAKCAGLTSLLSDGAAGTPETEAAVPKVRAIDAFGLAYLRADDTAVHDGGDAWTHCPQDPVQRTAFADSFRHLASRVGQRVIGEAADSTVFKTATKAMLPLSHRDR